MLGGALRARGMASFADQLRPGDVEAIHAYVISRALHAPTLVERALEWAADHVCLPASWLAD
ncbi:MAG: hypothetical protein ACE5IL_15160 [Myxococcota bacterium]